MSKERRQKELTERHCKSGVTLYLLTSLQVFTIIPSVRDKLAFGDTVVSCCVCWTVPHLPQLQSEAKYKKKKKKKINTNEMWHTYMCTYIFIFLHPSNINTVNWQMKQMRVKWFVNTVVWRRTWSKEAFTRFRITGFKKEALQSPWFLNELNISVLWGFSTDCAAVQTAVISDQSKIEDRQNSVSRDEEAPPELSTVH